MAYIILNSAGVDWQIYTHTHTHTHMHFLLNVTLSSRKHSPRKEKKWFKREENLSSMLLRDLTVLTAVNSSLFHLCSPVYFTVSLGLYSCTPPSLSEPCEADEGEVISPLYSGFDIFKVKDRMKTRDSSSNLNFMAGTIRLPRNEC